MERVCEGERGFVKERSGLGSERMGLGFGRTEGVWGLERETGVGWRGGVWVETERRGWGSEGEKGVGGRQGGWKEKHGRLSRTLSVKSGNGERPLVAPSSPTSLPFKTPGPAFLKRSWEERAAVLNKGGPCRLVSSAPSIAGTGTPIQDRMSNQIGPDPMNRPGRLGMIGGSGQQRIFVVRKWHVRLSPHPRFPLTPIRTLTLHPEP